MKETMSLSEGRRALAYEPDSGIADTYRRGTSVVPCGARPDPAVDPRLGGWACDGSHDRDRHPGAAPDHLVREVRRPGPGPGLGAARGRSPRGRGPGRERHRPPPLVLQA